MIAAILLAAVTNVTAVCTNLPPQMVPVWRQAERESRRTAELLSNGAIDAIEAARRRVAIRRAFARVCRAKGVPEEEIAAWLARIQIR